MQVRGLSFTADILNTKIGLYSFGVLNKYYKHLGNFAWLNADILNLDLQTMRWPVCPTQKQDKEIRFSDDEDHGHVRGIIPYVAEKEAAGLVVVVLPAASVPSARASASASASTSAMIPPQKEAEEKKTVSVSPAANPKPSSMVPPQKEAGEQKSVSPL